MERAGYVAWARFEFDTSCVGRFFRFAFAVLVRLMQSWEFPLAHWSSKDFPTIDFART